MACDLISINYMIQIKSISKINFKNDFSVKFIAITLKRKAFYKVRIFFYEIPMRITACIFSERAK